MLFMNHYEIDEAVNRWAEHPYLGPASRTLAAVRDAADACSDGWCYWPKPCRAAAKLMTLIQGDRSFEARYGDRDEVTLAMLKAAYSPLKGLLTRERAHGLDFEIELPGAEAKVA